MLTAQPTSPQSSPPDRVIRVFVSSTFRDMQQERDVLIKRIFPQLRKMCAERAVTWTEVDLRWGITTEESAENDVLPLCLAEIERCRPWFIGLLGERYGWVPDEAGSELLEEQRWLEKHTHCSVTELEIVHGVLRNPTKADRALFYFRDPKFMKCLPASVDRTDFTSESPEAAVRLEQLKNRIRAEHRAGNLVFPPRESYADPEALGEQVLADCTAIIERLYPKAQVPGPLDLEASRHEAYAQSRRFAFVGREDLLDRLNGHLSNGREPLVLTGDSGCGKSALLAECVASWREHHAEDLVLQHYIGSTPGSADWQGIVRRIVEELKRAFAIPDDIPFRTDTLRNALNDWLVKAVGSRRIVLVLDGLDQLAEEGAARQLGWLPMAFPPNVRVLISTLPGESLDVLRKRGWLEMGVPLFSREDVAPAVEAYLKPFGKKLPKELMDALESTPAACNALYLRAVLDELRQFGKHSELKATTANYLSARDLRGLGLGAQRATYGDFMYLPWWYTGEVAEVDIYPPPRPSADARLSVSFPTWGSLAEIIFDGTNWTDQKAGIRGTYMPANSPNHLSIRLSGRQVPPASWSSGELIPYCMEWAKLQMPMMVETGGSSVIVVCDACSGSRLLGYPGDIRAKTGSSLIRTLDQPLQDQICLHLRKDQRPSGDRIEFRSVPARSHYAAPRVCRAEEQMSHFVGDNGPHQAGQAKGPLACQLLDSSIAHGGVPAIPLRPGKSERTIRRAKLRKVSSIYYPQDKITRPQNVCARRRFPRNST